MSNKESIKSRIKKGEVVVGPFCIVPSGTMIDTLGYSGMDFCILDTEHGPLDMQTITDLVMVANGTGVDPIVRVGENNERLILRALDIGATGVQVPQINVKQDAVIIDALFGIGLNKKIEGIFKDCVDKINNSKLKVIAVDIPSGIYGDNGKVMGEAVRADVTLALHAKKLGHKMYPGSKLSGKIKIIDIGIYQ